MPVVSVGKRLFLASLQQTCNEYLYLNINKSKLAFLLQKSSGDFWVIRLMFSIFSMFSMFFMLPVFSKLTPCSPIWDGRIQQFLQPCILPIWMKTPAKLGKYIFRRFFVLLKDPCVHCVISNRHVLVERLSTNFSSSSLCGQSKFIQICWISTLHHKRYVYRKDETWLWELFGNESKVWIDSFLSKTFAPTYFKVSIFITEHQGIYLQADSHMKSFQTRTTINQKAEREKRGG